MVCILTDNLKSSVFVNKVKQDLYFNSSPQNNTNIKRREIKKYILQDANNYN